MTSDEHVELPALNGLDPLGFLAALGTLRLLDRCIADVRLSFDPVAATARLTGVECLDRVVEVLVGLVESLEPEALFVGLPAEFVPAPVRGAAFSDPGRIEPSAYATFAGHPDLEARQWARGLWTDLARDKEGRCAFTPFYAPTGKQTLRTAFEKTAEAVRGDPAGVLHDALASWRRIDGFTGENLDFRAVRGAADQQDGRATMSGTPGATWLALTTIPLFPMGGDGVTARTRRWSSLRYRDRPRPRLSMSWPVWEQPLDIDAVGALLAHPSIDRAASFAARRAADDDAAHVRRQLQALGVQRVVVAHRRQLPGGKAAGVLVSAVSWS
jgi:CRISPR-associated endonuclease/helicase Cas3